MAIGAIGGMRIMAVQWPRRIAGYEDRSIPAHPHLVWLVEHIRWLPRSWAVFSRYRAPLYRDNDPLIDERRGMIFCSAAQVDALRREIEARNREERKWLT